MAILTKTSDLIHGVEAVLEEIRPSLAMHGGDANLMKIENGVVFLKLQGSCHGCPMSVITFGMALKEMLQEKFPNDVKDVVWDEPGADSGSCCAAE